MNAANTPFTLEALQWWLREQGFQDSDFADVNVGGALMAMFSGGPPTVQKFQTLMGEIDRWWQFGRSQSALPVVTMEDIAGQYATAHPPPASTPDPAVITPSVPAPLNGSGNTTLASGVDPSAPKPPSHAKHWALRLAVVVGILVALVLGAQWISDRGGIGKLIPSITPGGSTADPAASSVPSGEPTAKPKKDPAPSEVSLTLTCEHTRNGKFDCGGCDTHTSDDDTPYLLATCSSGTYKSKKPAARYRFGSGVTVDFVAFE